MSGRRNTRDAIFDATDVPSAAKPQPMPKPTYHHESTARQSRNQSSEYLPQRRKGRKGRRLRVKIIRVFIFLL